MRQGYGEPGARAPHHRSHPTPGGADRRPGCGPADADRHAEFQGRGHRPPLYPGRPSRRRLHPNRQAATSPASAPHPPPETTTHPPTPTAHSGVGLVQRHAAAFPCPPHVMARDPRISIRTHSSTPSRTPSRTELPGLAPGPVPCYPATRSADRSASGQRLRMSSNPPPSVPRCRTQPRNPMSSRSSTRSGLPAHPASVRPAESPVRCTTSRNPAHTDSAAAPRGSYTLAPTPRRMSSARTGPTAPGDRRRHRRRRRWPRKSGFIFRRSPPSVGFH